MNKERPGQPVLTRDYLLQATYRYLQRFATTEKNLRDVLDRKARRHLPQEDSGDLYARARTWINDIVQTAVEQNLVDDYAFAVARATSLARSGTSRVKITQKLLARGVRPDMVVQVMQHLAQQHPDMDFSAAVKYARKRRFGAFASDHDGDNLAETPQARKQEASMCRAGFSYSIINKILKMSREQLEDSLYRKDCELI